MRRPTGRTSEDQSDDARQEVLRSLLAAGGQLASELAQRTAVIPSGVFAVDHLLLRGVGGLPLGRALEIFGQPASGKTLLCLNWVASAQRQFPDLFVGYLDAENSLIDEHGLGWAQRQGVNLEKLLLAQGGSLGDLFTRGMRWARSGQLSLIVLDSLGILYGREEVDEILDDKAEWDDRGSPGGDTRATTKFIKALKDECCEHNTCLIVVNQIRDDLRAVGSYRFSPERTPGGWCLKYAMDARIRMQGGSRITEGGDDKRVIGQELSAQVYKAKFCALGAKTGTDTPGPLRVLFDRTPAIDCSEDVLWAAARCGVITQKGAWYEWPEKGIKAQGKEAFLGLLDVSGMVDELKAAAVQGMADGRGA